ncbi:MAG: hypothetical protein WD599_00170 [Balneolaceae bacterium]
MEEFNTVTIYWLISIGLLIGFIIDLIMGRRGMHLFGNLVNGVVASVIIGLIAVYLDLFGALLFASVGTVSFLFLVNIFSTHSQHKNETNIAKN